MTYLRFEWDAAKSERLRAERGFGFEDIVAAVNAGHMIDDIPNPSSKYRGQRVMVIAMFDYVILVPYVRDADRAFLKTAFPSRKARKKYRGD